MAYTGLTKASPHASGAWIEGLSICHGLLFRHRSPHASGAWIEGEKVGKPGQHHPGRPTRVGRGLKAGRV
jgi:hypothetical protein